LQDMARETVEEILENLPDELPMINDRINKNLVDLAEFVSRARTPVSRDFHGNITVVHFKELPARIYAQVYRLGQMFMAIAQMNGRKEMDKAEERLLYKFLLNSIPRQKRDVLYTLFRYKEATTKSVAHLLNIETESIKLWLSDLNAHGITKRTSTSGKDFWHVAPNDASLLSRMLDIPITDTSLDTKTKSEAEAENYKNNYEGEYEYNEEYQEQEAWERAKIG